MISKTVSVLHSWKWTHLSTLVKDEHVISEILKLGIVSLIVSKDVLNDELYVLKQRLGHCQCVNHLNENEYVKCNFKIMFYDIELSVE